VARLDGACGALRLTVVRHGRATFTERERARFDAVCALARLTAVSS
jgi:hypothetical protein